MSLAYDRAGSGPALVLLHPLGADRHVWRPVLERLTAERDVLTVDLPGFGDSPALADGIAEPAALAAAVSELLRDLDLDGGRAHLAGNSLGGWVALETALRGDAATVTAIAPAGFWPRPLPRKPEVARRIARSARPLLDQALASPRGRRTILFGSMAHPDRVPADDARRLVRAYAAAPGFSAANRAMRAGTFTKLVDVGVPVTLGWAEHDKLVFRPDGGAPRGVRERVLTGCGHIPMWDDPEQVAQLLLDGSDPAQPPRTSRRRTLTT